MNFYEQVIGHTEIIEILKSMIDNNRVPHGLLFWGEEGIGKSKVAKVFGTHLLAKNETPEQQRITMLRTQNNNHPDLFILELEEGKTEISTGQIEEINKKCIVLSEKENGYRVFIIKNADKMNVFAANRFLKTLEEPPKNVIFILISSNKNSVLPTILSRCQTYFFSPLPSTYVSAIVSSHFRNLEQTFPAEIYEVANYFCNGQAGKAIDLINNQIEFVIKAYNQFLGQSVPVSYDLLLSSLENYISTFKGYGTKLTVQRKAFITFLEYSVLYFREFLLTEDGRSHCKLWVFNASDGANVDSRLILRIMDIINKYHRHLNVNGSVQILMYAFCIELSKTWNSHFLLLK